MSILLASAGISQCMKFHSIKDDEIPSEIGPDKDFFVGSNVHVTLQIPNGETFRVKDIVVLGKLTVKSTDMENTAAKSSLVAHSLFVPGHLKTTNIKLSCKSLYQPENVLKFKEELQGLIIDWFKIQRECAEKIGLRSILV
ncbi:MAG: hypothetical protein PVI40_02610 [Chlamydiota bacterium]|jgi:hypothetical protein